MPYVHCPIMPQPPTLWETLQQRRYRQRPTNSLLSKITSLFANPRKNYHVFLALLLVSLVITYFGINSLRGPQVSIPSENQRSVAIIRYEHGLVRSKRSSTTMQTGGEKVMVNGDTPAPKTEDNMACSIPSLNYKDYSIQHTFQVPEKPKCPTQNMLFDFDYKTSMLVSVPRNNSVPVWTNCCYKAVFRVSDHKESLSEKCFPIPEAANLSIPVEHEFLAVFCDSITTKKQSTIQVLAHAPLKPSVEARVKECKSQQKDEKGEESANLVILVWDSLSHMNLHRNLPEFRKYLVNNLSAFWFDGYSKIGEASTPNGLAFLTGLTEQESRKNCSGDGFYDECPIFWKKFAKEGYRTSFAEDTPDIGTFTVGTSGFRRQPVDYYSRHLSRVAERMLANDLRGSLPLCLGPQLSIEILLSYMKSVATTMGKDKRYTQFIWSTATSHEFPTISVLGQDALLDFVEWMNDEGHFNQTIFVFLSDHGFRWGKIRETPQGKIEDNMPFLYFVLPKWLQKKYPVAINNFKLNRQRLTTHFDTHETFLDLADLTNLEDDAITKRTQDLMEMERRKTLPRGISLFLPIPPSRTCDMAGIPDFFCVCGTKKNVPIDGTDVIEGAKYLVSHLNKPKSKGDRSKRCAELTLESVLSANVLLDGKEDGRIKKTIDMKIYEVGFATTPGNGSFIATLKRKKNGEWSVLSPIARTNGDGNQSHNDCS